MRCLFNGRPLSSVNFMLKNGHGQSFCRTKGQFSDILVRTCSAHPSSTVIQRLQFGEGNALGRRYISSSMKKPQFNGIASAGNVPMDAAGSIRLMFSDRNVCDGAMFGNFVKQKLGECNARAIAELFRLSGQKSKSKSSDLLKKHLPAIASRL